MGKLQRVGSLGLAGLAAATAGFLAISVLQKLRKQLQSPGSPPSPHTGNSQDDGQQGTRSQRTMSAELPIATTPSPGASPLHKPSPSPSQSPARPSSRLSEQQVKALMEEYVRLDDFRHKAIMKLMIRPKDLNSNDPTTVKWKEDARAVKKNIEWVEARLRDLFHILEELGQGYTNRLDAMLKERDHKDREKQQQLVEMKLQMAQEQALHDSLFEGSPTPDPATGLGPHSPARAGHGGALETQVQSVAKRAFWDLVLADLRKDPADYERVLTLLEEVRNSIAALVPKRTELRTELEEKIDIPLLRQMMNEGAFDGEVFMGIVELIVSKILFLEAPARNDGTKAFVTSITNRVQTDGFTPGMLPEVFEFCFDKFKEIRLDTLNFQLSMLKPHLQEHGVEYENEKFTQRLKDGLITLDITQAWLMEVVKEMRDAAKSDDNNSGDAAKEWCNLEAAVTSSCEKVVYKGVLKLLLQPQAATFQTCPETLRLDVQRLVSFQNDIQRITLVALQLNLVGRFLAEKGVEPTSPMLKEMKVVIVNLLAPESLATLPVISTTISNKLKDIITSKGKEMTDQELNLVQSMVKKTANLSDGVYQLLNRRLVDTLFDFLNSSEPVAAPEGRSGLQLVSDDVIAIATPLRKMLQHNLAVHSQRYNSIISSAVASLS